MSKSTSHSRLSSTATSPDLDINNIQFQNLMDLRSPTTTSDKRLNNVNYVRHVLRKFFGVYSKKPTSISPAVFDDCFTDQSTTTNNISDNLVPAILIHPCLQYDKHAKFSGRKIR